jgi:hypothetical protein
MLLQPVHVCLCYDRYTRSVIVSHSVECMEWVGYACAIGCLLDLEVSPVSVSLQHATTRVTTGL